MVRVGMLAGVAALGALAIPVAAGSQTLGIQPGQWETAVTINSMEMSNAPASAMQAVIGRTQKVTTCVSPADAAKGPQEMMKTNKACSFTKYDVKGGRLTSEMTCNIGRGTMTATSTGAFTPTSFNATGRSVTTGPMNMTMTTTTVGRRLGDCTK